MRGNIMLSAVFAIVTIVLAPALSSCITFEGVPAEDYGEETVEVAADERFEVIAYEHANFMGRRDGWALQPGMRQKLVEFVGWGMNDRISAIKLGYMVGVALFKHRDFRGPAEVYLGSQSRLDFPMNDECSSLIIFHKDVGEPLGAWMGGTLLSESNLQNWNMPEDTWFYPLPEDASDTVAEYRGVGEANDRANWVMVSPVTNSRAGIGVEVTLYEHDRMRGASISLPGFRRDDYYFDLTQMQFERKVSSLVVREIQGQQFKTRRRYRF